MMQTHAKLMFQAKILEKIILHKAYGRAPPWWHTHIELLTLIAEREFMSVFRALKLGIIFWQCHNKYTGLIKICFQTPNLDVAVNGTLQN